MSRTMFPSFSEKLALSKAAAILTRALAREENKAMLRGDPHRFSKQMISHVWQKYRAPLQKDPSLGMPHSYTLCLLALSDTLVDLGRTPTHCAAKVLGDCFKEIDAEMHSQLGRLSHTRFDALAEAVVILKIRQHLAQCARQALPALHGEFAAHCQKQAT